jgi:hypothetical protein
MKPDQLLGASALLAVLALAACGGQQPRASTSAGSATVAPTATPAPTPTATATPAPTPAPVSVPDFQVVAYQGADAFGGQQGHFAAAFASGRPVVLLYFAGL